MLVWMASKPAGACKPIWSTTNAPQSPPCATYSESRGSDAPALLFERDYDTCLAVATRGVELARGAGALTVLAVSVNVMAQAVVLGGNFGRAALLVAEADSVTDATGARVAPYGALVLAFRAGRPRRPG
jgi:hypothetical protein